MSSKALFLFPSAVVVGHRERVDGRSGGHGFTVHIRDVYFSRYLDRPGLTHTIITFLSTLVRKKGSDLRYSL